MSKPELNNEEKKPSYISKLQGKVKNFIPKKKAKTEKPVEGKAQKSQRSKQKEELSTDASTRKQQKEQQKAEKRKNKKPRRRIFPIWLRIIVVLLLCAIALASGAMVGYGIIGNGNPSDVFDMDTWRHIINIVTKTEE